MIGQTLNRELFQGESPIGKEIRIQNVAFRVIGVLSPKGANMMGMDQDDIVLAPGRRSSTASAAAASNPMAATGASTTQVNTLDQLYPAARPVPALSATDPADTPQPVRFANVDQILTKAATTEQIQHAIDADHRPAARAAPHRGTRTTTSISAT